MNERTFATALNCIDGRVQEPVSAWVKKTFKVDSVDTITEPGIDLILSSGTDQYVSELKRFIQVSINAHGSRHLVLAGHFGCAADPVDKAGHLAQILKAVEKLKSWNLGVAVVGLYVNDRWEVEQVTV